MPVERLAGLFPDVETVVHINCSPSSFVFAHIVLNSFGKLSPRNTGSKASLVAPCVYFHGATDTFHCAFFFFQDDGDPIIKFRERNRVSLPTMRRETFPSYFRFVSSSEDAPCNNHVIVTLAASFFKLLAQRMQNRFVHLLHHF